MVIANPIYDTIFKRLMENRHIVSYFIKTLTGEQLIEVATIPQEYTYHAKVKKKKTRQADEEIEEYDVLSVIRYDFVATIRNSDGETKKIIIEIQKSSKPAHLLRFRTYLGEQYRRTDIVKVDTGEVEQGLPIICIYVLGFKLPDIKTAALKVGRTYIDMIGKKEIKAKNKLVEALTHDGYFVQVPRIKGKPKTSLEKLLSVFEQQYFIDEYQTRKEYEYPVDDKEDKNIKEMLEILKHAAADEKARREMEEAWFADRAEKDYEDLEKEFLKSKKLLEEERKKAIEEKLEIVKKLLKANIPINIITESTGLTKEEIENL